MKELFLVCALALPSPNFAHPHWSFGEAEVKVVRLLRDWPNGHTGSRPRSWVLIYGRHPLWTLKLREDNINVVMMFREKLRWPNYIQGDPIQSPFAARQFQVYIYDWFPMEPVKLVQEASRIVDKWGFFLYRFTKNGIMAEALQQFGWERFSLDFHEFTIWWRPKNYDHIEFKTSILLSSSA